MSGKRRGLGRGLDALLQPEAEEGVREVALDRLRPNRHQPRTRFDEADLESLAQSIRARGIVQPLLVTPEPDGFYMIIAGERRWLAARRAGLEAVPVMVREVSDEEQLLELALIENLQRTDLNPMEEAEAYQTLQRTFQLSQEEIAARVGKARSTVTNSLRLLNLPEPVRQLVREGALTAGQARPLIALGRPEVQIGLAEKAVQEGLTARDLERLAARRDQPAAKTKVSPPESIHDRAAAEKLTQRLQTKVEIRRRGKGGALRIHFHTEEELMRLYDYLMQREE